MSEPAIQQPLRVLGIDPGLADVGWGAIEMHGGRSLLLGYGVIQTRSNQDIATRLDAIYRRVGELIDELDPSIVAIENLYFAKNAKTAMVVAHGRAAAILATAGHGIRLCEYTPLQIKQALTGHGRAGKAQVQSMVRVVLGLEEVPRPDHAADALAAALCHIHSQALDRKVNRAMSALAADGAAEKQNINKMLLAQMKRHRR